MSVTGIVLAAGGGQRFGGAKALADFGGQTLVERALCMLRNAGCAPVIVVAGAEATRVRQTVAVHDVILEVNQRWQHGQAASLQAGLAAATRTQAAAAVVALVDQPLVTSAAVGRLVQAFRSGATAAVATYDGVPRNPALFSRDVWPAVAAAATGDVGARTWLQTHPEIVTRVECGDVASPADIDTLEDMAMLVSLEQERR